MVNTGMRARQGSFVHVPTRKDLLLLVYYLIPPHLCRCFLLMTAAAAAFPVWRLQLKVCVSSEGRPGADRQAPTHRYPAVALSRCPQEGPPVAAGSTVITPLPRHVPLTGSYTAPPSLREVSVMHQELAVVVRGAGAQRFADLFAQLCLQPAWECESARGRTHAAFTARRTPC